MKITYPYKELRIDLPEATAGNWRIEKFAVAEAKKHGILLTIHNADAFTWKWPKGTRYNWVWHDIWDYICADNLKEMTKLKRKFGRITDSQDCWCEYECRRNR